MELIGEHALLNGIYEYLCQQDGVRYEDDRQTLNWKGYSCEPGGRVKVELLGLCCKSSKEGKTFWTLYKS